MAVRRQPLSVIRNENAEINRGNTSMAKSGGLKVQQPDLSERKTLSNITNKIKPLPNSGNATPIASLTENNAKGGFTVMADPEFLRKSAVKGRAAVPRTPLCNITNMGSSMQKSKAKDMGVKEKKPQSKNLKMGPNPKYEITEEMKQKAEVWAQEGVEKVNFTGKDMEALREKMAEEEMNRLVAQALSYKTEIPCWLPCAFVKDSPQIKDHLELDLVKDLYAKGDSSCFDVEQQLSDVDYDETFYECLEILQTASKDWPAVVGECK